MSGDARFEDGGEGPVRLRAESAQDLTVISALLQDAVLSAADISWMAKRRRLAALVNRFRWEDREAAERAGRPYERARAMLVIDGALKVSASGVDPREKDLVLSILSLDFTPGEDGTGTLRLILAGDGEIAVAVECLDVTLHDVTRPYAAPSRKAPRHD
ncbi:DUF2948 family protein [Halovulum dunhuangense]|uniref:DUF2948 family protein n=1 Tax=Halovulum dunhuangense TaxID=1505036 RepID=A0A849L4J6_9RHOB|nr:DUF2948 family protein [Halovulum dunhuangense]NNU81071.1 DUF2948 family protein [Halovulum dunhuangense]